MSNRFFEGKHHAEIYAKARQQYCKEVFEKIVQYCSGGQFKLAVDVACGTGHQSTLPLTSHFEEVVGVDVSEEQLKQAPDDVSNLKFRQCAAEELSFLSSGSVDLVTIATALHWVDIPKFFREADRVLVPGGCLAVYSYEWCSFQDAEPQRLLEEFEQKYLVEFYNEGHRILLSGYASVDLPFPNPTRDEVLCRMEWTMDKLVDFIASISPWQMRLKVNPDCNSLDELSNKLLNYFRKSTGCHGDSFTFDVVFRVIIMMARKPR